MPKGIFEVRKVSVTLKYFFSGIEYDLKRISCISSLRFKFLLKTVHAEYEISSAYTRYHTTSTHSCILLALRDISPCFT